MSEKKKNKREFWLLRIKDWETSGLNKIAYCRLHNISLSTFYYWQDILKKKPFTPPSIPSLIPIRTIPASEPSIIEKIEVKLPVGIIIQIPMTISSEKIVELILSLGVK